MTDAGKHVLENIVEAQAMADEEANERKHKIQIIGGQWIFLHNAELHNNVVIFNLNQIRYFTPAHTETYVDYGDEYTFKVSEKYTDILGALADVEGRA